MNAQPRQPQTRAKRMVIQPDAFMCSICIYACDRHMWPDRNIGSLFSSRFLRGRLIVSNCSQADRFCVPMIRCLKNDREIRDVGALTRLFASTRTVHVYFFVTSEWRCRHRAHQDARRSKVFSSCLLFPFLPRIFPQSKTNIYSRINLGVPLLH